MMLGKLSSSMLSMCLLLLLSLAISSANGTNTGSDTNMRSTNQQNDLTNTIIPPPNNTTNTNSANPNELNSVVPNNTPNTNNAETTTPVVPNNTPNTNNAETTTPLSPSHIANSTSPSSSSTATVNTTTSSNVVSKQPQISNKTNELQKKLQASIPTYLILVNINMPHKNTTDYGVIDTTVTLNNATKVKSLNSTTFSGDHVVMPFRFNAQSDNAPIQINDKFNTCVSGEFLAAAVCNTGVIKTTSPPLTKADISLG
jgi:hypothetical protein